MSSNFVLVPRWLITMTDRQAHTKWACWVKDGTIQAVGAVEDVLAQASGADVMALPDSVVMPGLINAHTHVAMNLLRGQGSDLPLMQWLETAIWPLEDQWVNDEFVFDGSYLAGVEMAAGGITTANDMYMCPVATVDGLKKAGLRVGVAGVIVKFPNPVAGNTEDERIANTLKLVQRYADDPLVKVTLGPHAPYTVSDHGLEITAQASQEHNLLVHMHVHETRDEVEGSLQEHGCRPLARLDKAGLLTDRFLGIHAVHLTDDEIQRLVDVGASVIHCPSSNMKLASGFAPTHRFKALGLNWGIGTDGAASNDKLDMFAEMRLASLLAKGNAQAADAMTAWDVLEAATINGAKALHWSHDIGSLEVGKAADIIAIDMNHPNVWPVTDVAAQLVYSADRSQVQYTWVKGQLIYNRLHFQAQGKPLQSLVLKWDARLNPSK